MHFERIVFRDEDEPHAEGHSHRADDHNKKVLRAMVKHSPISCGMLVIVLLMFVLCVGTDMYAGRWDISSISPKTLLRYGANFSIMVQQGQYYRIFSAMFLHAGILHLLMNSTSFLLFLMPVEARLQNRLLYASVLIWGGM